MSFELIAILLTALLEVAIAVAGFAYIATLVHRAREKMDADDSALYLQGKRVEEVVREMRAELRRP